MCVVSSEASAARAATDGPYGFSLASSLISALTGRPSSAANTSSEAVGV